MGQKWVKNGEKMGQKTSFLVIYCIILHVIYIWGYTVYDHIQALKWGKKG